MTLAREQWLHDCQAERRSQRYRRHPRKLTFRDADYLDHESWIRPAFAALGAVAGRRVLDLGCGHGMAAVVLARAGADVTALELSSGYLREARQRAAANAVNVQFVQADGQRLPFAAQSFDAIWGHAIVHHLDVPVAARELRRVLKPSGVAVLCEPWGENPLLQWVRQRVAYTAKERTPDESPLRQMHIDELRAVFNRVAVQRFQLLSMVRRVLRIQPLIRRLEWCDELLLTHFPCLQQFCRYVVLTCR